MPTLFDPITLGDIDCANRIFMAPMTRSRAGDGDTPTEMNAHYYGQRASSGLIITEGVYPNFDGKGYVRTPGIVTEAQIAGWKQVAEAVHAKGGKIVMQLMHCGRVASLHNKPKGSRTLAPSAIQAKGEMYTDAAGMQPHDMPEEMTLAEIEQTISDFGQAAKNAVEAGCDGVELHCTSGYLPAQFLSTGTNKRNDRYGGALENRLRFVVDVLSAMIAKIGAGRVGIRICPGNPFNDLSDENPEETFKALIEKINPMSRAYLHVIRMKAGVDNIELAKSFTGPVILNDSYDLERGNRALMQGQADAISFGRHYVANPDLVEKFREGRELAKPDYKTLYTPGPKGYVDY
ncbi:alkene reductase [Hellea balneolensis]|uniref:alkene reductase n=1 Tax=Hellea balneolensis TaxID=287478 RepID=UPI0004049ECB|nr:alkene reductase [Hellea balneolensis]